MNQFPTEEEVQEVEPTNPEIEAVAEDVAAVDADAPAVARGSLTVWRGGAATTEVFEFTAPAIIGRFDPTVGPIDIDLGNIAEGAYVSRKHAAIVFEDGKWLLRDLGSSNGSYVRGADFEKIEEAELADGTEIALGNARFVFHILG